MDSKSIVFRIVFCIGLIVILVSTFLSDGGLFSFSMWDAVSSEKGGMALFLSLGSEFFMEHWLIGVILIFWLPAVLLIVSALMTFIRPENKLGLISGGIGIIMFIIGDILIIAKDIADIGTYMNLAGVAIAVVGIVLSFSENPKDKPESPAGGEITCVAGEFAGGIFYCNNVLTIGRDAHKCNLILSNNKISHVHCVITYIPQTDTYTVRDMSKNGTYFSDGKRLVKDFEMQVARGTEIYMGEPKERFILD